MRSRIHSREICSVDMVVYSMVVIVHCSVSRGRLGVAIVLVCLM